MTKLKPLILAVEDEPDILRLLKRTLEQVGYEVMTAADGGQALALAAEKSPTLVLLNIKMPGKSGMVVLQELTTRYEDVAVVMVSGIDDVETAIQAMMIGAYDYIVKPFNINEIVISVERALQRRELILENRTVQQDLERRVAVQTQELELRLREITALNNLFTKHLRQRFEVVATYRHVCEQLDKLSEEISTLAELARAVPLPDTPDIPGFKPEDAGGQDRT